MHHNLLVSTEVVEKIGILLQGLADSRHVPVAKNSEAAPKESALDSIPPDALVIQKPDRRLRGCHSTGGG